MKLSLPRLVDRSACAVLDAAAGAWLWLVLLRFARPEHPVGPGLLVPALLLAAASWVLRYNEPAGHAGGRLARTLLLALTLGALGWAAGPFIEPTLTPGQWWWWSCAAAGLTLLLRLPLTLLANDRIPTGAEALRLLFVGACGWGAVLPFYTAGSIGAGDAYWYSIMLADVVTQLRAGVFPVWVGQSEYAFNGTVYPLRLAPAFQYGGAILDFLTAGALSVTALKNAVLVVSAMLGAYSAYFFVRPVATRAPHLAALLAGLWVVSPGVLAPLMMGDMYMTFMTLPFVPMVVHGCWRLWARDDHWAHFWLGVGLAGTFWSHAPIALWLLLLAGGHYAAALVRRRRVGRSELVGLLMTGGLLLGLGAYPAVSAATVDNQLKTPTAGASVLYEVKHAFPANFLPIDNRGPSITNYQLGATLALLALISLALIPWTRNAAATAFALTSLAIAPFVLPVPGLTDWLWLKLIPGWFIAINNVWPMQRLFLIWGAFAIFAAALVAGSDRVRTRRWSQVLVLLVLVAGTVWSWSEARRLARMVGGTRTSAAHARAMTHPDNVQLTRYAYSSFSSVPTYTSHGYMEPWWENRLLHPTTLRPFLSNADAAAPPLDLDRGAAVHPRLVQSGVLEAVSVTDTDTHDLRPALVCQPGQRYALRVEFLEPGTGLYFQLMHRSIFREYILPDSGVGLLHGGPPRAFGSLPSSSRVLPFIIQGDEPVALTPRVILPRRGPDPFPIAKYWLYTYERAELPIVVQSWVPYRAKVETAVPALLETPRLWLRHWRAWRDGVEIPPQRSPNNLVMIPVEPGQSDVVLEYRPPLLLHTAFGVNMAGWVLLGGYGLWQLSQACGRRRGPGEPAAKDR